MIIAAREDNREIYMRHATVTILLLTGLHAGGTLAQTAVIDERYITERVPDENIDSVAVAPAENGQPALLFATAKSTDVIKVYDASTGEEVVEELGGTGPWPDNYLRPNGVAVADGLLVVVERDNRRINVRSLPDYRVVDTFGYEDLRNPYGVWLQSLGDDRYRIWVTDAYEMPDESVPPNDELNERIKSFRMTVERNADGEVVALSQHLERTFGETTPPGALRIVESIFGDADRRGGRESGDRPRYQGLRSRRPLHRHADRQGHLQSAGRGHRTLRVRRRLRVLAVHRPGGRQDHLPRLRSRDARARGRVQRADHRQHRRCLAVAERGAGVRPGRLLRRARRPGGIGLRLGRDRRRARARGLLAPHPGCNFCS